MLMKTDAKLLENIELFDKMDQPSLERLAYLLRHKDLWPKGFKWNFCMCERCAMGLAIAFWNIDLDKQENHFINWNEIVPIGQLSASAMVDMFHISSVKIIKEIFYNENGAMGDYAMSDITPEIVADK